MKANIRQGLDAKHTEAVIQLFCDTFPEIILPVFGSIERCARLLEGSLTNDRVLTAISNNRLIGFAGLHFSGREWFDPSLSRLVGVMQWSILRVIAMGIILFKRPKPDVLHLDTLTVHPDARDWGIGTQLIQAVEARAESEGKRRVTLEVEDINPGAKRLYERVGFLVDKFEKLPWPWSTRFSFSGLYHMSKEVMNPGT